MIVGMDTTIPMRKRVVLLTTSTLSATAILELQRDRTERKDGRHPEANEEPLLGAASEPQYDGQNE